jgi:hypothetical protein
VTREKAIGAAAGMVPRLLASAGLVLPAELDEGIVVAVSMALHAVIPEDAPIAAEVDRIERADERV